MGQLNIKDEALIAEAKALAAEMGTSTIGMLREALRATRERHAAREAKIAAMMAIAEEASRLVPPGVTSDHAFLYDENGAPK